MIRLLVWGMALVALVGAALLTGTATPDHRVRETAGPVADTELARCRAAGQAALVDPACRRAWDQARARFFGHEPGGRP